jgi:Gpi18-like mannosyltransferase
MANEATYLEPMRPAPLLAVWRNEAIVFPTIIFLALRVFTAVAAFLMIHNVPAPPPQWLAWNPSGETFQLALLPNAPLANVVAPWHRYDTAWYVKVAIQGYQADDPAVAFPPLYPLMIRVLAPFLGNNYVLASLIISNVACLIALILLYKLIELEFSDSALARRTLVILAAFPTAFYLVAGYTESLYLALTLGAFLAAFKRQWWLAGLIAAVATLTRLQGAVLCIPLAWIAYVQYRERGLRAILERVPVVAGSVLAIAGYLGYLAINQLGSPDGALQSEWQLYTRLPFDAFITFFNRLSQGKTQGFENDNALALLLIIIFGLVVTFKFRPAYSLYVWTTLGVILLRYHYAPGYASLPQFESIIRYALLMFPCFIAAGMILRRWWLLAPYVIGAGQWMLFLLNNFTHWIWVA